jgi:hypothetical protein
MDKVQKPSINEELHNLYSSPNIIRMIKSRRMRWTGHVAPMLRRRMIPGGKRPLGRPRHMWVDNIKMDLRSDSVVWTGLIWLRMGTGGGLL